MDEVRRLTAAVVEEVVRLRRDFHAHPELGFEEHRTAGIAEKYLHDLGIPSKRVAKTGVVGMINGLRPAPVVMLRADMDALPVMEQNDIPYRSENPGVMHACGHDAHTAILLGAAKVLTAMRDKLLGCVKLVFQPNEESAGALEMIEQGVLTDPAVDAAMALHIWTPIPSGKIGVSAGAVMAGLEIFKITVKGSGGHTGFPELVADPIMAAGDIIQTVQRIQMWETSLAKPTVIRFGRIAGGTKANIIPDAVTLEGSIRTFHTPDGDEKPMQRLKRLAEEVCAGHRCRCEVESYKENIPLLSDPELAQLAAGVAQDVVGRGNVLPYTCTASEDFSEFSARVPGVFVFLGTGDERKGSHHPHHSPFFNIDEDTLPLGVEMYVRFALTFCHWKTKS